jgi:DNA-binding NtrC family response regulator
LGGNIRQLRNVAEQISVLETNRDITAAILQSYLPSEGKFTFCDKNKSDGDFSNERDFV